MERITAEDLSVLKPLAEEVALTAALPIQKEREELWRRCNQRKPVRPMVFADPQNGWSELVPEDRLLCKDPFARTLELQLRRGVFRIRHLPDDFFILPELEIPLNVQKSSWGFEEQLTKTERKGGAYHIEPVIRGEEDFAFLHPASLSIDWQGSKEAAEAARDALGDILTVRLVGKDFCRCGLTRQLVHMRGLEQMMYDVYDEPELFHKLMDFLMREQLREFRFYEEQGALSMNTRGNHLNGTGGLCRTDELSPTGTGGTVLLKDMMAWGESQEFVSVGPAQFEEFVLRYQLPVLERFGIVDYGCCEPLDHKYDLIMSKIPNLRSIAVPTWADSKLAAKKIGDRYVYAYKPNPAHICAENADMELAQRTVQQIIEIAMAENCPLHIIMKDTNSFFGDLSRIGEWAKGAVRLAEKAFYK